MASKKVEKDQARTPAEQLLLEFLKLHNISLVVDRVNRLEMAENKTVYMVNEKVRLRAFYADQLQEKKQNEDTEKVELVQ